MTRTYQFILLLMTVIGLSSFSALSQDVFEITVAGDGSGDFTTIQNAIDASKSFPDKRVTIYVKNGVYNEKVEVPACNTKLSIIGESREETIIRYGDYFSKINRGSSKYTISNILAPVLPYEKPVGQWIKDK